MGSNTSKPQLFLFDKFDNFGSKTKLFDFCSDNGLIKI